MASMDVTVTNQIKLRFNWSQASQNISNNNSVVSWSLQLISTTGTISSSANKSWSVTVNGSKYSGTNTIGISTNTTKTLASGSTTIAHNSDGTKTFSFSFSQQFDINYSGVGHIGTKSGSGSGTLTTIPRTSSVSATSANIGSPITITINRASSSFTHTLTYSFCNLTGTIATKTGSTSVSWTLPTSFYAQIPNAKSSWGRIICQTYNGNTLIGSSECRFDVYVNESSNKPTISATVVDSNATTKTLTGDENKLIKYYSTAKFTVTGSPKNSATIKTLNATYNGNTASKTGVSTWTDQYSGCVSGSYSFAAIDSRGFSVSQTVSKTLINYIKLTCVLDTSLSVNGALTLKMNGNYFNGSFGAKNNSLRVGYRYKTSGGSYSNWAYVTPTISGNTYTATATVNGLDYQQSYIVQAWAGDQIYEAGLGGDVYSAEKQVSSKPIFDWGKNDFHFHVPAYINGQPILHEGNTNGPVPGNWCSGGMTRVGTDGVMEVGKYIDFHHANNGTEDYSVRLCVDANNKNIVYLPNDGGRLYNTGNHGCKRLAQGAYYMTGSQSVGLSDTVWNQAHGIVLVFSAYNPSSGQAYNFDWHTYFVPKTFFTDRESAEGYALITTFLTNPTLTNIGTKHLRVYNNRITGDDRNNQSGSGSGISFKNNEWVLRYVYGV